jgi:hypothetical protein
MFTTVLANPPHQALRSAFLPSWQHSLFRMPDDPSPPKLIKPEIHSKKLDNKRQFRPRNGQIDMESVALRFFWLQPEKHEATSAEHTPEEKDDSDAG